MNQSLRASVVIPVRNRPDLLARTLETLTEQTISPAEFEILVCDDGSTDDVAALVERFIVGPVMVRLERQAPSGPAAARNLGTRAALAPVVIFVDSDVIADGALIRALVEALDTHPEWQGAEAALFPAGEDTGILWDAPASTAGGHYHTAAIAYRRAVLKIVGGFDEEFKLPACEDVELAVRVLTHGPIGFVSGAKVWHPRRKVTALTHWRWRRHWRYETILAVRYGILVFPGRRAGPFPRLRVALGAVVTLPAGRFLSGLKVFFSRPKDGGQAMLYALFDVICGISALPTILFSAVPVRRDYLQSLGCEA
ncbi:glycosyltransferase family 2 protein [uncultured Thiodictyon sp.]|jgi:GT2 family glycosyltransferase|uniref:glycosyltransferase family 2 protein n=1 Tax=uncultured Thiodictyon sp. TaxID=1846217 RepID=UPI0025DE09FF|nr:glycosyltransferase family A protein [uncultured Thiodictyon sp.]